MDLNRSQVIRTVYQPPSLRVVAFGNLSDLVRSWACKGVPQKFLKHFPPFPSRPDTPCQKSNENHHHGRRGVPLPFPLRIDQSYKHEGDEERHEAGQIDVSYPTTDGMQNRTYAQRSKEYGRLYSIARVSKPRFKSW